MRIYICVEPSDRPGGAYFADQVLALQELERAIYGRLRQPGELLAEAAVNRFRRRMGKILSQRAIHRQPLRSNANAPSPALPLEFRAPAIYFATSTGLHFIAADYHLRIIIIWTPWKSS